MNTLLRSMLVGLAFAPMLASATPPNTTAANAVPYEIGQGWVSHYFDDTTTTRWFTYGEVGGRSYCLEAVQGSVSPILIDPSIAAYTDATGTTPLVPYQPPTVPVANDNGGGDPRYQKGARACYIANGAGTTTTIRSMKVTAPISAGDSGFLKIRVVETSLYVGCWNTPTSGMAAYLHNLSPTNVIYATGFENYYGTGPKNLNSLPSQLANFVSIYNRTGATGGEGGMCIVSHTGPPGAVYARVRMGEADDQATLVRVEMRPK